MKPPSDSPADPNWLALLSARLSKIQEAAPGANEALELGKQEQGDLEYRLKCERIIADTEGVRQDIAERKKYASKTFRLICCWLLGVFALLLVQGFLSNNLLTVQFKLSDGVLLAVVGGTTASVIGIFVVVVSYLFPKR